jgi:hypothetical protein
MLGSLQVNTTHDKHIIYSVQGLNLIIPEFKNQPSSVHTITRYTTQKVV